MPAQIHGRSVAVCATVALATFFGNLNAAAETREPLRIQFAQTMPRAQPGVGAPTDDGTSKQFVCQDGSRLLLDFGRTSDGVAALVSVHGDAHRLPALPVKSGPVQLEWSDGIHSLTWSPGVRLMWMSGTTHLMCGRGGHNH